MKAKAAYECYHCKQWVEAGEEHDCWTTTERALTQDLSEELQDAYQRLREAAVDFGEQRVYASGSCIMFSRTSCYFFVRPKRNWLELAVFLDRPLKSPLVKRAEPKSKVKTANIIRISHRDEVEAPLTDWLREAYDFEPMARTVLKTKAGTKVRKTIKKTAKTAAKNIARKKAKKK
jgi:hypothetical protein